MIGLDASETVERTVDQVATALIGMVREGELSPGVAEGHVGICLALGGLEPKWRNPSITCSGDCN